MKTWQEVFREGLAPLCGEAELAALRDALAADDPRLIQGATTAPPPMSCVQDWPPGGACLVGLMGWLGAGLGTVGEVEEYFARMCFEMDRRLDEPAGCRWLLNAYDETPRGAFFPALLAEVEAEMQRRSRA